MTIVVTACGDSGRADDDVVGESTDIASAEEFEVVRDVPLRFRTDDALQADEILFAGQRATLDSETVLGSRGGGGLVVALKDGVPVGLGLAPKPEWLFRDGVAPSVVSPLVDARTTAVTLAITGLGSLAVEPEIQLLIAGALIDTPELDAAARAIEAEGLSATERGSFRPDLLLAVALERISENSSAPGVLPTGPGRSLRVERMPRASAPCLADDRIFVLNGIGACPTLIETGSGLEVKAENGVPRWISVYDKNDELVTVIPPRSWEIPGAASIAVHLLEDIARGAFEDSFICRGWRWLSGKGCGDSGGGIAERVEERWRNYVSNGTHSFTLPVDPDGRPYLQLFGPPTQYTRSEWDDYRFRVLPLALTAYTLVVLPTLALLADTGDLTPRLDSESLREVEELLLRSNDLVVLADALRDLESGDEFDPARTLAQLVHLLGDILTSDLMSEAVLSAMSLESVATEIAQELLEKAVSGPILKALDALISAGNLVAGLYEYARASESLYDKSTWYFRVSTRQDPGEASTTTEASNPTPSITPIAPTDGNADKPDLLAAIEAVIADVVDSGQFYPELPFDQHAGAPGATVASASGVQDVYGNVWPSFPGLRVEHCGTLGNAFGGHRVTVWISQPNADSDAWWDIEFDFGQAPWGLEDGGVERTITEVGGFQLDHTLKVMVPIWKPEAWDVERTTEVFLACEFQE